MKETAILLSFLFVSFPNSYGQYNTNQNKNWQFDAGAGLTFMSGSPVPISSNILTNGGSASVSDPAGNLLFYTDGKTVYDKTGSVMPSGLSIVPFLTSNAAQAAAIAPVIGSTNQYYVFSLEQSGFGTKGRLAYSIIDMTLNGGLGDIVPSSMGTIIDSGFSGKMIVVSGNNCDLWLIVHPSVAQQFNAYEITSAGINTTPVISLTGTFTGVDCYGGGVMKCSPDRNKIVAVSIGVELYDFNASSGIVSNCRVLISGETYGAEFSPDNSKLYIIQNSGSNALTQFDISLATTAAIIASKFVVAVDHDETDLKLAPDDKIYMLDLATVHSSYMDCINAPNLAGSACNYISHAIHLTTGTGTNGLPNVFVTPNVSYVDTITGSSEVCIGASTTLSDDTTGGIWGTTNGNANVAGGLVSGITAGLDTVTYSVSNACGTTIQTHTVTVVNLPDAGTISGPSSVCVASSITLTDGSPGGVWSSSNTDASVTGGAVTGMSAGIATISYSVTNACATAVATSAIAINPLPNAGAITGAGSVCVGAVTALTDAAGGGIWIASNSSASVSSGLVTGASAGLDTISYFVTNVCGTASVMQSISILPLPFAGSVTGPSIVCVGANITITDPAGVGAWSSSNGNASVLGGVVSGLITGTSTISYSVSNSCGTATATHDVTMASFVPVTSPITASTSEFCAGTTSTLSETSTGGVWSSSNNSAVVSGGVVRGIAGGVDTISYSIVNGCGSALSVYTVTIDPLPNPGKILGSDHACPGFTVIMNNYIPGGTWSTSDGGVASVTSSGIVSGLLPGNVFIIYTTTNACGSTSVKYPFTVLDQSECVAGVAPLTPKGELTVYPNPATDELNITGVVQGMSYRIYSITSTCLIKGVLHEGSNVLSVRYLIPGIYVLEMTGENGERNMVRVVKE